MAVKAGCEIDEKISLSQRKSIKIVIILERNRYSILKILPIWADLWMKVKAAIIISYYNRSHSNHNHKGKICASYDVINAFRERRR